MIDSNLIRSNARSAMAVREILSIKRRGAAAALVLMLVLGVGVLAGSPPVHAQEQKPAVTPAATTVNINTADAETLAVKLKGVGDSRAMEIVRYREAYGPFASADELTEVKGIGKATLDMNRDVITLE